jgi:dihydrofolate reductase
VRDLIITQNITLDGVIDNDAGWFGPADHEGDVADQNDALMAQAAASDAFLVGRTTFEEMRGHWPQQQDDRTGVTDHLNRVAKYVGRTGVPPLRPVEVRAFRAGVVLQRYRVA